MVWLGASFISPRGPSIKIQQPRDLNFSVELPTHLAPSYGNRAFLESKKSQSNQIGRDVDERLRRSIVVLDKGIRLQRFILVALVKIFSPFHILFADAIAGQRRRPD